jgi:hypothetical protein
VVRVVRVEEQGTMRVLFGVAVTAVALGLLATPAEAYLDPGTGSYVFQMVAAAVVSVAFVARAYWHRVRGFFARRDRSAPPKPPDER